MKIKYAIMDYKIWAIGLLLFMGVAACSEDEAKRVEPRNDEAMIAEKNSILPKTIDEFWSQELPIGGVISPYRVVDKDGEIYYMLMYYSTCWISGDGGDVTISFSTAPESSPYHETYVGSIAVSEPDLERELTVNPPGRSVVKEGTTVIYTIPKHDYSDCPTSVCSIREESAGKNAIFHISFPENKSRKERIVSININQWLYCEPRYPDFVEKYYEGYEPLIFRQLP